MKYTLLFCSIIIFFLFINGCSDKPKTPEEKAFGEAESKILVYVSADSGAYGNTETARQAALKFARLSKELQSLLFTGGNKGGLSLTGDNFVTYCRINKESAVFLIHVPDLKNYHDNVRKNLIRMLWAAAKSAVKDKIPENSDLVIALKGTIFYGGLAMGKVQGTPVITNSSMVSTDPVYKYFK